MRNWKEESGQVLVLTALSMVLLIGFVGFAIDVGVLLHERRIVQTAADSAAIAAASESLLENTPSTVTSGMWYAASNDAALDGFTTIPSTTGTGNATSTATSSTGTTLTISIYPNVSISDYNYAGYVQAVVTHSTPTVFMGAFGALFGFGTNQGGNSFGETNVSASAIASSAIPSNGCIYVMNGGNYDPDNTVDMGGDSLIAAPHCGMSVNGSINMTGNSTIDVKFVAATGSISGKNASSTWASGVPPVTDPMLKLQQAANQPSNFNLTNHTCDAPAGSGMGCLYDYNNGSLTGTLQSNTIYVFDSNVNKGGGPTVSGTVTGSGITIYLAGNIPFDFSNNGSMNLTPPGYGSSCAGSTNPFCGILIDAPTDGSNNGGTYTCSHGKGNNQGNPGELYFDFGSSTTDIEGIVYAPYAQLFTQDKGAGAIFNTDLVIGNICSQSSTINVNGYSPDYSPLTRVGLVY